MRIQVVYCQSLEAARYSFLYIGCDLTQMDAKRCPAALRNRYNDEKTLDGHRARGMPGSGYAKRVK